MLKICIVPKTYMTKLYIYVKFQVKANTFDSHVFYYIAFMVYIL